MTDRESLKILLSLPVKLAFLSGQERAINLRYLYQQPLLILRLVHHEVDEIGSLDQLIDEFKIQTFIFVYKSLA